MDVKDFVIRLSEATGVSGYETARAKLVLDELKPLCDDGYIDNFGNAIAVKKGRGKGKIMFAAHMDEIGLMVSAIDDKGFVKLATIGGFDQRTLLSQEVIIHGSKDVFGVLGAKPPHITSPDERKNATKLEDMAIDTGLSGDELREIVHIGDLVTVNRKCVELQGTRMAGKAMDDCACIASFLPALRLLKDVNHDMDVYFVATAQEEVGCRGAIAATNVIKPDIGIAIDVTFARTQELNEDNSYEMGKGPEISVGPNAHRKVYERLKEVAKDNGIKHQLGVSTGVGGTDAYTMQIGAEGVATCVVSVPLRYMHTSVEVIDTADVTTLGRLLGEFVRSLNNCDMEEFLCL